MRMAQSCSFVDYYFIHYNTAHQANKVIIWKAYDCDGYIGPTSISHISIYTPHQCL